MNRVSTCIAALFVLIVQVSSVGISGAAETRAAMVVSSLADSGAGTLREALTNAQGGDSILFDPALANGTIFLSADLPVVSIQLIIDGEYHNITIDGGGNYRSGFELVDGADVVVRNLTFSNGYGGLGVYGDGGAFRVEGEVPTSAYTARLVVQDCSFLANRVFKNAINAPRYGGAVFLWRAEAVIEDSIFTNNVAEGSEGGIGYGHGGAIALRGGTLSVERSELVSNSADSGGAIYTQMFTPTDQVLSIVDSTFRLNTAIGEGDAFFGGGAVRVDNGSPPVIRGSFFGDNESVDGYGGAILVGASGLRLENSTFFSNASTGVSSQGGAIYAYRASLSQVTIAYNSTAGPGGGGVRLSSGPSSIENSILANNTANGIGNDCASNSGGVEVWSSLIERNSSTDPCTLVAGTGNITFDDPELNSPADNGGSTWTMSLRNDSPVLDQGDPATCLVMDQRRRLRLGGVCDMGAFESGSTARCAAFNGTTEFATTNHSAIELAIADQSGTNPLIRVAGTCVGGSTTAGAVQTVYIDEPLTLAGGYHPLNWSAPADPVGNETVIDAAGTGRVIRIFNAGNVSISGLTIQNGVTPGTTGKGGGIYLETSGDLTVARTTFRKNSANSGGGVYLQDGTASFVESSFFRNMASNRGGGIYNLHADTSVAQTTFARNSAFSAGGGLINVFGVADIQNSTFSGNRAYRGAGFRNDQGGLMAANHVTVAVNNGTTSSVVGIGVDNVGDMTLSNSIVADSSIGLDCDNPSPGLLTVRNSFVADGSCITPNVDGNLSGDPQLELLLDNGGTTLTHGFDAASDVLGAGGASDCLVIDQRGFTRATGACDMGAFELNGEPIEMLFADGFESGDTSAWSSTSGG